MSLQFKELKHRDYRIRQLRVAMLNRISRMTGVGSEPTIRCGLFGFSALESEPSLNERRYVLLMHPANVKTLREEDRGVCYPDCILAKGSHKFLPSYNDSPIITDLSVPENEVYALSLDDSGHICTEAGIVKLVFSH